MTEPVEPAAPEGLLTPDRLRELVAWALHDLRGPLRTMDAALQMLREEDSPELALEIAERGARRLGDALDGMAAYSEAFSRPLAPRVLDAGGVAAAARAAWEGLGPRFAALPGPPPELEIAPAPAPDAAARAGATRGAAAAGAAGAGAAATPGLCLADPDALQAIFAALFENAALYGRDPGGRAQVRLAPAPPERAARAPGLACLQVRDGGKGVPRHMAGDIFEPMRRLHARSEVEGAGFGLSVARLLAVRQGGALAAAAGPAPGGCFELRLPRPCAAPAQDAAVRGAALAMC